MEMTFRPLTTWPGAQTASRKASPFRAKYEDTLKLLDTELRKLGANSIVLQCAVDAEDVRLDGQLRASARPRHPGVILSFHSRVGPLSYPCDSFRDWQDNLRAIALALEALRQVERYGVTKRNEQYRGWTQLPSPNSPAATIPLQEAGRTINNAAGATGKITAGNVRERIAEAIKRAHPDHGGKAIWLAQVLAAAKVLKTHFGIE